MEINIIKDFLLWAFVVNYGILLFWFIALMFAGDFVFNFHSKIIKMSREDFNNDKVDAGEIGAGHTVTAIYEIALTGKGGHTMDPLRYKLSGQGDVKNSMQSKELAFLRLRYKKPDSDTSILLETPVLKSQMIAQLNQTSHRFQFAASVAGFGQLLRGGRFTQQYSYNDVVSMAVSAKGIDRYGYRSEFVRLVELANTLSGNSQATTVDKAYN